MQRKVSIILCSSLIILAIMAICSLTCIKRDRVSVIKNNGLFSSYSLEKIISSTMGEENSRALRKKVQKDILKIPYIDSVYITSSNNTLTFNGVNKDGIILFDGDNAIFYDGEIWPIEKRDIPKLREAIVTISVDSSFLLIIDRYRDDERIKKTIGQLFTLKDYNNLISNAIFGNNYGDGLFLDLDSINASLYIKNIRDINSIKTSLSLIEEEYYSSRDRLNDKTEYILEDSRLVRIRGNENGTR